MNAEPAPAPSASTASSATTRAQPYVRPDASVQRPCPCGTRREVASRLQTVWELERGLVTAFGPSGIR